MREGQRDGEDEASAADEPTDDTGADQARVDESADQQTETAAAEQTTNGTTTTESRPAADADGQSDAGTASTDGGAAATTVDPEQTADEESEAASPEARTPADSEAGADADADVDEAVETVSGTRAELPSTDQMEAAMAQTMEQVEDGAAGDDVDEASEGEGEDPASPATGIAGDAEVEQTQEADTRILEFTLDDEQYCLDIQYIEEIVKHTAITRVPNTPEFVEGVVDLRGQITTILNPKVTIDKPNKGAGDLIVVFDSEAFEDQGHIGWVVDDVRQVSPISEDDVNDPPMQEDYINGVIDRDDGEFVIWTTPDLALDEAE
jgi:purine-binding chemotaxis protein CheW